MCSTVVVGTAGGVVGGGGLDPLVGRDRECRVLAGCLAAVSDGDMRLVLCRGEPGIGKTRLAAELAAMATARDIRVLRGQPSQYGGTPPYWPWRQVLAPLVDATTAELGPMLSGTPAGTDIDHDRRFALFEAVTAQLRTATATAPLVVVLEDLHWADEPTLLLLGHVGRVLRDARLLVMATYRDTEPADAQPLRRLATDLARHPHTERLDPAGLTVGEVRRRLAAVTGADVAVELARRVHAVTGGNPFFVAELGRCVAAGGSVDSGRVPAGVRDAIEARLDRLTPAGRRLLHAASVAGRQFSVAVVAGMLDVPVVGCLDALDEAVAAGLLVAAPDAPGEHRFAHVLIGDALAAGQPTAERLRLHRAAAVALEAFHAGRLEPHLSDLARHWAAAALVDDRATAASWSRRAAHDAMGRLAFEEGVRLFRQAVRVGGTDIGDEDRFDLLHGLADALHRSGDLTGALDACREAAGIARRLGRLDLLGAAALVLEAAGSHPWDSAARELCEEALAGLGAEQAGLRARLMSRIAEVGMYLDDEVRSGTLSATALALARESGDLSTEVAALRARQLTCSGPEGTAERAGLAASMLAAGRALHDPRTEMWARLWRVDTCFEYGDLAGAARELDGVADCVDRVRGPLARWNLLRDLAALAQAQARFADALRIGRHAFEVLAPMGHPASAPSRVALHAAVGRHIGHDPDGADTLAHVPQAPGAAGGGAPTVHVLGVIDRLGPAAVLAESGRLDEAAALYRGLGPALAWSVGGYFGLPLCALGIGVAVALRADEDVAALHERLAPFRGRHVVSGAGVVNDLGPVELHLGIAAGHLGRLDDAVADLEAAAASCAISGAAGFAVEARAELAGVLSRRRATGDLPRARRLLAESHTASVALGMRRQAHLIADLRAGLDATPESSPLTVREDEVAGLVARGMTNREIGAALVLSERTAEGHVQHILTKLLFTNRSQIAAWVAGKH